MNKTKCGTCEYFLNDTYTNRPDLCGICAMNANEYDDGGLLVGADHNACEEYMERQPKKNMNENGLLPCPFCGGKAEIVVGLYDSWTDGYAVKCCNCCLTFGAYGRLSEAYEWTCIYESEEEAIDAWNTRYQIPCETCSQIDNPDSFIFHLLQIEH